MCYMWIDGKVEEYLCNLLLLLLLVPHQISMKIYQWLKIIVISSEWHLWVNFLVYAPWKFPREKFPWEISTTKPSYEEKCTHRSRIYIYCNFIARDKTIVQIATLSVHVYPCFLTSLGGWPSASAHLGVDNKQGKTSKRVQIDLTRQTI